MVGHHICLHQFEVQNHWASLGKKLRIARKNSWASLKKKQTKKTKMASKSTFEDWKSTFSSISAVLATIGALASYQGITAVYDTWRWAKNRRNINSSNREEISKYRCVVEGKIRRRWRLTLPTKFILCSGRFRHRIVRWVGRSKIDSSSKILCIRRF